MKIKRVFVRFYKSFNYDDRRKIAPNVVRKPWEMINDQFYPHIEIPVESLITTVVGANESGKSHLLSAIEKAITGHSTGDGRRSNIERKDFCRYSQFFESTNANSPKFPDFGLQWADLQPAEATRVLQLCGIEESRVLSTFFFFRTHAECRIYLPTAHGEGYEGPFDVTGKETGLLPPVFRIDSRIAVPDGVSIQQLLSGRMDEDSDWFPFDRRRAFAYAEAAPQIESLLNEIAATTIPAGQTVPISSSMKDNAKKIRKSLVGKELSFHDDEKRREIKAFNLAHDLLVKITGINNDDIEMLRTALRDSETGLVRSLVDKINHALAVKLRFPRVWSQDRNFALRIEATEHELNFIINDRTGRQYSFDERSSGLKHFLSYYIQYLAHDPDPNATSEILLMDEPDAFLSGEAQQDLLKIFQMFADPVAGKGDNSLPVQVIYVTHSPFLIDKNHAERVRALEKPEGSKGTRVIKSGAQNHYEPVRSVFGPFVGETTFISQCNLMVEGLADQILLAGAATYLRKLKDVGESEMLDLNRITIVPAGGADNVPYLTYLARGRDSEKPAVIVLLDSDAKGDKAKEKLSKNGPHPEKRRVLDSKFILQLGEISNRDVKASSANDEMPFKVLEDLVPLGTAVRAAKIFATDVYALEEGILVDLSEEGIGRRLKDGQSPFEAIREFFGSLEPAGSIDLHKVPFARSVVDQLPILARERDENGNTNHAGLEEFELNMRALFRRLRRMQTIAEEDTKDKRMRQIVEEKIATFMSDFEESRGATRDDVTRLFMNIETDLEGDESERGYVIQEIGRMRRTHNLGEDPTERVRDFDSLVDGLGRIRNAKDFVQQNMDMNVPARKKVENLSPKTDSEKANAAGL